jgi:endonuclease-3 related protein
MRPLCDIYDRLLAAYGPQGWWPLISHDGSNPTKSGSFCGYHPSDYSFPHNEQERFEICAGSILTQNTAWPNAEKALLNLERAQALRPQALLAMADSDLITALRPCGYFNVKARKLRHFSAFFLHTRGRIPHRNELLTVWGIGPETADSMRLYAFGQPDMVVDVYTRRILAALGLVKPTVSYEQLRRYCCQQLPCEVPVYQEFHALLVEHAKRYYRRRPYRDPLLGAD